MYIQKLIWGISPIGLVMFHNILSYVNCLLLHFNEFGWLMFFSLANVCFVMATFVRSGQEQERNNEINLKKIDSHICNGMN